MNSTEINEYGLPNDGDDFIDVGDSPDTDYFYIYGQGGNDKIIGGINGSYQELFGGKGDDKIWALNPGQFQTEGSETYAYGGPGNDIIYGAPQKGSDDEPEYLYGDFSDEDEPEGGDDIIYTGDSSENAGEDYVYGGGGNDRLYGQGFADHVLIGGNGDDYMRGGEGDNLMHGDEEFDDSEVMTPATGVLNDDGVLAGDDTMHGEGGDDSMYAGPGDDYVYGGEGDDYLFGSYGDDTLWGDAGSDQIFTGTGWDTVFGGDGCDIITSHDGADVIWAGDCDPDADDEVYDRQWILIHGTGPESDNYTVLMDFWDESAMPYNVLCMYPDHRQGMPASGMCTVNMNFDLPTVTDDNAPLGKSCLSAVDIMSARATMPAAMPMRTRGGGCKNDGGPLWVTVELADSEDDISSPPGGGDAFRTVWGKIFQKKQDKSTRRRSRSSRYAQVGGYPTETKSDLEECFALQLCTATGTP